VADVALRLDALVQEEALLLVAHRPLDVLEVDLELEEEDVEVVVELLLLFVVLPVLQLFRLGDVLADRGEVLLEIGLGLAVLDVLEKDFIDAALAFMCSRYFFESSGVLPRSFLSWGNAAAATSSGKRTIPLITLLMGEIVSKPSAE
jgi:hypothetical protein